MDRELSADFRRKQQVKIYWMVGLVSVLLLGAFLAFRSVLKTRVKRTQFTTSLAQTGSIEATLTASGVVIPEYEQVMASPIQAKIERVIHNAGEEVESGEPILELDKEYSLLSFDKLKDEQELNKNKATRLRLNLEKALNDLETQYSIKKLQIKSLETAVEDEVSLLKVGGSTAENKEQAELKLQIARFELKQLQNQINNQRELMKADLKDLGFQMSIQEKSINELGRKIKQAEVRASRKGVITWVNDQIGTTISPGEELVRIADLSSFKVEGSISDSYAEQLKPGGEVIIQINNKDLRGKIANVRPAVENGTVKFMVTLDQKDHKLLRSNLKVDVFVVTSFKDKVIRVKNGPAFNGSVSQEVFVMKGDKAVRRPVKTGESNFDFIEIKSGLQAGEEVIITDMNDFIHQEELMIASE